MALLSACPNSTPHSWVGLFIPPSLLLLLPLWCTPAQRAQLKRIGFKSSRCHDIKQSLVLNTRFIRIKIVGTQSGNVDSDNATVLTHYSVTLRTKISKPAGAIKRKKRGEKKKL